MLLHRLNVRPGPGKECLKVRSGYLSDAQDDGKAKEICVFPPTENCIKCGSKLFYLSNIFIITF